MKSLTHPIAFYGAALFFFFAKGVRSEGSGHSFDIAFHNIMEALFALTIVFFPYLLAKYYGNKSNKLYVSAIEVLSIVSVLTMASANVFHRAFGGMGVVVQFLTPASVFGVFFLYTISAIRISDIKYSGNTNWVDRMGLIFAFLLSILSYLYLYSRATDSKKRARA